MLKLEEKRFGAGRLAMEELRRQIGCRPQTQLSVDIVVDFALRMSLV